MTLVALAISLFVVAMGALGVVSPPRLIAFVRRFQTPGGLYTAAALRLVLGAALYLAAPDSRAPDFLHVLGVVIFVAGVITPLFGLDRFRRLLAWWESRGVIFIRAWALVALLFGLGLTYLLVANDSARDDLEVSMAAAGYREPANTFLLWEGVSHYQPEAAWARPCAGTPGPRPAAGCSSPTSTGTC